MRKWIGHPERVETVVLIFLGFPFFTVNFIDNTETSFCFNWKLGVCSIQFDAVRLFGRAIVVLRVPARYQSAVEQFNALVFFSNEIWRVTLIKRYFID